MAIEIVDFPMKNGGSFNSYVKLPEGMACDIFLTRFDQVGTIVSGCAALAMATVKNCLKGF